MGRRRREQIDHGLAVCIAGQVAAGLARAAEPDEQPAGLHVVGHPQSIENAARARYTREVEDASARARGALVAIGLMLRNAAPSPEVEAILALAETVRIEVSP